MSPMEGSVGDALAYPFARYPAAGEAVEVADGIFWLSSPLPFAGLRQINLWLLSDGDGWTMVDCGYSSDVARGEIEAVWKALLGGRPVKRLIVTHFHPDHVGNAAFIAARWGLTPLMTQAEWLSANLALENGADSVARRAAFFRAHGLGADRIATFEHDVVPYAVGVRLPPAYARIRDGDVIDIGGDRWTVLVGEGHSPEHAALYCAERRILISGDQVLPTITTNISVLPSEPEADPLGRFLASLRRIGARVDRTVLVLPSHRLPFRNIRARLDALARHHDERLGQVLASCGAGATAAELIDALFPRALDGHQLGFAMGEAIAHLNHLVALGRLARQCDPAGVYRFKTADGGDILTTRV